MTFIIFAWDINGKSFVTFVTPSSGGVLGRIPVARDLDAVDDRSRAGVGNAIAEVLQVAFDGIAGRDVADAGLLGPFLEAGVERAGGDSGGEVGMAFLLDEAR